MRKLLSSLFVIVVAIFVLSACNGTDSSQNQHENDQEAIEANAPVDEVVVSLMNSEGMTVATATLIEMAEAGVKIILEGDHLPPGEHGFHIHDAGQCIAPDFESAGSHYNPTDSKHGFDHPDGPHAGDLENIIVEDDGTVYAELEAPMVTLNPDGENTLFTEEGTSLIIHDAPDDYITQPTGGAGARIACGVIGE